MNSVLSLDRQRGKEVHSPLGLAREGFPLTPLHTNKGTRARSVAPLKLSRQPEKLQHFFNERYLARRAGHLIRGLDFAAAPHPFAGSYSKR